MKILSDNAVTRSDLDAVGTQASKHIDEVDAKQAKQIQQLRIAVGISFAANLVFAILLKFL